MKQLYMLSESAEAEYKHTIAHQELVIKYQRKENDQLKINGRYALIYLATITVVAIIAVGLLLVSI